MLRSPCDPRGAGERATARGTTALAAVMFALAACGGGSSTPSGAGSLSSEPASSASVSPQSALPAPSAQIDLATADPCGFVAQDELNAVAGRAVPFAVTQTSSTDQVSGTICTHSETEIHLTESGSTGDWTIGCSVDVMMWADDQGSVESRLGGGFVDISGQIGAPAVQNSRTHDPVLIKDPRHFVVVACRRRADSAAPESNLPDMAIALLKLIAPRVK